MTLPSEIADAVVYAREAFALRLLVESAGLFWLGAEAAILFAVCCGRDYLEGLAQGRPGTDGRAWLLRAWRWGGAMALLAALVLGRHMWAPPVHSLLGSGAITAPSVAAAIYAREAQVHRALWAGFVAGWVLLEVLIVFQGWRAYGLLRDLLGQRGLLALCMAAGLGFCAPAGAEESMLGALKASDMAAVLYDNALQLWLRLAGVVWIGVEWVAAYLIWRGYRMLARAVARREEAR